MAYRPIQNQYIFMMHAALHLRPYSTHSTILLSLLFPLTHKMTFDYIAPELIIRVYQIYDYLSIRFDQHYIIMSSAFIQVDKPFYFAGDTIQGHIFLNLVETINANQILVKFKGWQAVRWIEERVVPQQEQQNIQSNLIWHNAFRVHMESSDSSDHPGEDESMRYNYVRQGNQLIEIKRYSGGRIISRFSSVLYNFGGTFIPPGQYSFPFSFKTGQDYPASFIDKSSDSKRKGRIKYEMQAFIRGYNSRIRIVRCKSEIIIRETTEIKNEKQEMQAHVKSCCCCDQGTTRIRCFFEKNGYSPGEDAKMYCVLDNKEGKAVVQRVSVALKNDIVYTSRENHQKHLTYTIFENSFSGLGAGEDGEREQVVKIINQSNKMNPMEIKPTARGLKLRSTYYLQVEAVLSASCTCCSELPVVKQPILIYPWIPNNNIFQAPSNWHPEVMQMVSLKMNLDLANNNINAMNNPYA